MDNLLVKEQIINSCKAELAQKINDINVALNGVDDKFSTFQDLSKKFNKSMDRNLGDPDYDYFKGHLEINKVILDARIDLLVEYLKCMKVIISHDDQEIKNVYNIDKHTRQMISEAIKDERNRFRPFEGRYFRWVVNEYDDDIPYGTYYYSNNNDKLLIFINDKNHITMMSTFDPKQFTL